MIIFSKTWLNKGVFRTICLGDRLLGDDVWQALFGAIRHIHLLQQQWQ